ncbi:MAG: class I SAM-dependent methyltransferase [Candidatus Omnitrophica bacterium]|nr:class I SAM-dependent methyltransferase [Candidatus Omnitrophota bacterium]
MQCVSCGGKEFSKITDYIYKERLFKQMFPGLRIMKCRNCGLCQVCHQEIEKSKLDYYYENIYRDKAKIGIKLSSGDVSRFRARGKALVGLAKKYLPESVKTPAVFELGAGYGFNLAEFKKAYRDCSLFTDEIDKTIEYPPEVNIASPDKGQYDVVLLSHVLEHLKDPKEYIYTVLKGLKKDGIMIVETPNDITEVLIHRGNQPYYHEPHITFFDKDSISYFFKINFSDSLMMLRVSTAGDVLRITSGTLAAAKRRLRDLISCFPAVFKTLINIKSLLFGSRAVEKIDYTNDSDEGNREFLRVVLRKIS